MRAAQKICEAAPSQPLSAEDCGVIAAASAGKYISSVLSVPVHPEENSAVLDRRIYFQREMSAYLSHIRSFAAYFHTAANSGEGACHFF